MRKPAFCICENKDADQLRGNREADQRLCFRYSDSSIPLLPKSKISSLWPSSVTVQPGLCGTWSETPKTGFLTTRLIWACYNEVEVYHIDSYIDDYLSLFHISLYIYYGSRAPVCNDRFLVFMRQPHGVVSNTSRLPYENTWSQGCRNVKNLIFDILIFFAIFLRFLVDATQLQDMQGCRKTAALLGTQGVRITDVIVCHPRICLAKAARLSQDTNVIIPPPPAFMPRGI